MDGNPAETVGRRTIGSLSAEKGRGIKRIAAGAPGPAGDPGVRS
jgi:hypothetical protein